jgi:8-oxo-dGTP diphosphatase
VTEPADEDWAGAPLFGAALQETHWVIRPSVYALVADGAGRVAIVRSVDGIFLPGGGIEPGEGVEEALRREALEECGFDLRVGSWALRAVQFAYSRSAETHFEKRSRFIECAIEGPTRAAREPGHELIWAHPPAAVRMLSHESHAWAVTRWAARVGSDASGRP